MNFPDTTPSATLSAMRARDRDARDGDTGMGARRSMAKSLVAFAVLTPVMVVLANTAAASETRCMRGDDAIRRVEIAAQDPNGDVPCEVVYWKDTEQPGVRSVLWSAQTDAAFCARKAEELVDTLKSAGWSCAMAGEQPRSASRDAPPAATSRDAAAGGQRRARRRRPRRARLQVAPSQASPRTGRRRRPRHRVPAVKPRPRCARRWRRSRAMPRQLATPLTARPAGPRSMPSSSRTWSA